MSVKVKPWGVLEIETGLVCFDAEDVKDMAKAMGISFEDMLESYSGIKCEIASPGYLRIDTVTAVTNDQDTYDMILVGAEPAEFKRFLHDDEPEWNEFFDAHPMRSDVGGGLNFNPLAYEAVVSAYKLKLREQTNA